LYSRSAIEAKNLLGKSNKPTTSTTLRAKRNFYQTISTMMETIKNNYFKGVFLVNKNTGTLCPAKILKNKRIIKNQ